MVGAVESGRRKSLFAGTVVYMQVKKAVNADRVSIYVYVWILREIAKFTNLDASWSARWARVTYRKSYGICLDVAASRFGSPSRMAATILSEALAMSTRPKPFCLPWAVADMPCPWPPKPRTRQPDHSQRNEVKSPPGLFQFFSQIFSPSSCKLPILPLIKACKLNPIRMKTLK